MAPPLTGIENAKMSVLASLESDAVSDGAESDAAEVVDFLAETAAHAMMDTLEANGKPINQIALEAAISGIVRDVDSTMTPPERKLLAKVMSAFRRAVASVVTV